jgi:hypothetical protein
MAKLPLILREKLYVPAKLLDPDEVKTAYAKRLFNEAACQKCPYLVDRFGHECEQCQHYLGRFKLFSETEIDGKDYIGLPLGNRKKLGQVVHFFKRYKKKGLVLDERPRKKFKHDIEFTGKAWDYQTEAKQDLIKAGYGVLESAPRTGKTVMAIDTICEMGLKTLILAAQYDWLEQFAETIEEFTNAKDIEKFEGKRVYGICEKLEDFKRFDIALSTYQQFIGKNGAERLAYIKDMFGVLFVDEVHDCFTYGHKVTTDRGKLPIGLIVDSGVDCKVLSYDHDTGKQQFKSVINTRKKTTTSLLRLTIEGKEFLCTPDHRFWSATREEYVRAKELTEGEEVLLHEK